MREIVSPLSGIRSPFGQATNWFLASGVWNLNGSWEDSRGW